MNFFLCLLLTLSVNLPLWARAADASIPQPPDNSKADERFRSMATDDKGHITFEGFQKRYPNMQRPAFDAIDADKDGKINLEEWRVFFQSHSPAGAMSPGRMPPPGHGMDGQDGRPLILPPVK